ncbi:MAG: uroporphyrinogen decarboxylase [candidate division Zixibacteria bacterium]|nr:uroporphyrinogen decarboxylase [candidate division Zixibacteria bacterium]MBU1470135.1 uroporphyrinogen decarboxylase [candidate division Zixibacteria bacterium]MBU2626022.1 uroporphyrinogen decarboxylase [candidate division Zixibacteria bacterium]
MVIENSSFIRACYGRNDGRIPIWIMRQAGRYLPEYRSVRKKVSFLELCRSPELIAEVVRQPIERFDLDAAILFSDILTPFEPMGVKVDFPEGGPQLEFTINEPKDVKRLSDFDIEKELSFVFDGIREIKKILAGKPLIGFAGSPFTLASYLIEGQASKNFNNAKKFIYQHPKAAEEMLELLTDVVARYLEAQIDAGADVVQVFDSWGGILSNDDYLRWSARPVEKIFSQLANKKVPRILFVNNLAPYIDIVRDIDCEVVGVDYRMEISDAAKSLPGKSVQGNLDPSVLFGTTENVVRQTKRIIDSIKNPNRLIFNLGHGILPETPIEAVQALVDTVHNYR